MTNTVTALATKVFAEEGFRFFHATYFDGDTGFVVGNDMLILGLDLEEVRQSAAMAAPSRAGVKFYLEEVTAEDFDDRRAIFAEEERPRAFIVMAGFGIDGDATEPAR